jgi:UDP:flavonoid glycosyltransferase YjiC (YdhE family)
MESLSGGTPVVVCPGFADQPVNAQKAVDIGVGLQVTRPLCELEEVEQEILKYKTEVKAAVTEAGSLLFRIIMFVTCGGPH